jgi:predicted Rdx family selenoprotein
MTANQILVLTKDTSLFIILLQTIKLDGEMVFDRATEGRFPEVKEIKQMIRDKVVPYKDLGHSDVATAEIDI